MPVTLDMFEYPNHAAAQDAFVSSDRWDETFEQDTIGQDPSRWSVGESGSSDVKIVAGKYCMLDVNGTEPCRAYVTVPFIKANGEFEIKGKAAQTNAHFTIQLEEGGTFRLRVAFFSDGHFRWLNPAGPSWDYLPTDTTYNINTWYTIKIKWYSNNTFDIWINGASKGTGLAFETNMTSGINSIEVRVEGTPTADFYVDDVIIGDSLTSYLQCYSEAVIVEEGSYSLKGIAKQTGSLNETLTRVVSPTTDLSDLTKIKLGIYAFRTGTNIKVRIRDSGGTWSEYSIAISSADTWETKEWDISGISNANKDAIDRIQFQIIEASADNVFCLDNMFSPQEFKETFTETINLTDTLKKKTNKRFTETLTLSDTVAAFRILCRVFTETLHLTDSFSRVWHIYRTFTENINLSDLFSRRWNIYRTYTENINLADTVAKKVAKTFKETLILSDFLIKKVGKIFTETLSLTDIMKKKVGKVFAETLTLTDTASFFRQFHRVFTETLHLTDSFSRVWTIKRIFTEKITLTDKVKLVKTNLVNLIKKLIHLEDIED